MLTNSQYLLTQLADEGIEVAQRCHKAMQFGLREMQPGSGLTNIERINEEVIDFFGSYEHCVDSGVLPRIAEEVMRAGIRAKMGRVRLYMDYAAGKRPHPAQPLAVSWVGKLCVECVAVRFGDIVVSLPRPKRHHHIIHALADNGWPTPVVGEEGFILSNGEFADRPRALVAALSSGQLTKKLIGSILTSEDLW